MKDIDWGDFFFGVAIVVIVVACFLVPAACSSQNKVHCANGTSFETGSDPSVTEVKEICEAGR